MKLKTTPDIRLRMSRQRSRDTAMEVAVRKALFHSGYRYRVHYPVPTSQRRSIDIAFPGMRLAVFVDGCFWHSCPEHGARPKNNAAWWSEKLKSNVARDAETAQILHREGWRVLRLWEHESVPSAAAMIVATIEHCRVTRTLQKPRSGRT